mgnify:CR=1 FL=1
MFENIMVFFKKLNKKNEQIEGKTNKDEAKERLHLVLMQDRANVSADFLDMMRQEIIDVIKKYIDVDEKEIDVRLTNKQNSDGTTGAPALYANIPIISIKNDKKNIAYSGKISKNGVQDVDNVVVETSEEVVQSENNGKQEENKDEETDNTNITEEVTLNQSIESTDKENNVTEEKTNVEVVEKIVEESPKDETTKESNAIVEETTESQEEAEKNNTASNINKNNSKKGKKSKAKKSNKKK